MCSFIIVKFSSVKIIFLNEIKCLCFRSTQSTTDHQSLMLHGPNVTVLYPVTTAQLNGSLSIDEYRIVQYNWIFVR